MVGRLVNVVFVAGLVVACSGESVAPAHHDTVGLDTVDGVRGDAGTTADLPFFGDGDGVADVASGPRDALGRADVATPDAQAGDAGGTGDAAGRGDTTPSPEVGPADSGPRPCQRGSFLLEAHVRNVRDLGGIPLAGGHHTACGALFRGSELSELTPAGCAEFARLGARTIVDLRTAWEREYAPNMACAEQVAHTVLAPLPTPTALSPQDYLDLLYSVDSMAAVFATLGDENAHPVYLHCIYGRDRTGVVAAVVLLALGATRDDILADYELTATTGMRIAPDSLRAVLDEVERTGGIEAYLARLGVTAAELAVLRAHAVVL